MGSCDAEAQTGTATETIYDNPEGVAVNTVGNAGSVYLIPPVAPGGALRALQGETVWLDLSDGSVSGAALWLSRRPPQTSRRYLRTFDIWLPWCDVEANAGAASPSAASQGGTPVRSATAAVD